MDGDGQRVADTERILHGFPKARPELPAEYRAVYDEQYVTNREGRTSAASLAIALEGWMHRQVARGEPTFPLLEIGAGTLNHVGYEPPEGAYDIVEPYELLHRGKPELKRLRNIYAAMNDVPPVARYERIISIAVLEHVLDLPVMVAKSAMLLAPGGRFLAGIPSEGSLLWYLAWRFGTGLAWHLRTGLDYGVLMRYEHVNTAIEILTIVRYFFDRVTVRRFPLPALNASLYTFVQAVGPKRDIAKRVLATRAG